MGSLAIMAALGGTPMATRHLCRPSAAGHARSQLAALQAAWQPHTPGVTSLVTVFPPSLVKSLAMPHMSCAAVT